MNKRILITVLCMCLLVLGNAFPLSAAADNSLLFQLDTATLSDQSGNDIAVSQVGTVTTGSFYSATGDLVSYMTTGDENLADNAAHCGVLKVTDDSVTKLTDYTVEIWAKFHAPLNNSLNPRLFGQCNASGTIFAFELNRNANLGHKFKYNNADSLWGSLTKDSQIQDQWHHYVYTYDTQYDAANQPTGVFLSMYLDGVLIRKSGNPMVINTTYWGAGTYFDIGGTTGANNYHRAFPGDIATFNIYSEVKNNQDVSDWYAAQKEMFVETTVSADSITFEDGNLVAGSGNVSLTMPAIRVAFTGDIDMSTVTEETLCLVDEYDGIALHYTVTQEGNTAVVTCDNTLGKNKQYCLKLTENILNNDGSAYGSFNARFHTVRGAYAAPGWKLEKDGSVVTAVLSAKTFVPEGSFAEHVLAVYQVLEDSVLAVRILSASDTVTTDTDLSLSADLSGLPAGNYRAVSMLLGEDLEILEYVPVQMNFIIE